MDYFVEFPEINLILKKIFVYVPLLALLRQSRHSDSTVKFLKRAGSSWNVGMYGWYIFIAL